jgi:hypothetical protein
VTAWSKYLEVARPGASDYAKSKEMIEGERKRTLSNSQ